MLRKTFILITAAAISIFAACDITDTGTDDTETAAIAMLGQDALLSRDQGPHDAAKGAFYPLAVGNTWTYSGVNSMWIEGAEPFVFTVEELRTITGTEELFGREYILEEQISRSTGVDGVTNVDEYWYRYRQDRAGLYEADVSITDPPGEEAAVPGGSRWDALWSESIEDIESIGSDAAERARMEHFRKIEAVEMMLGRRHGRALEAGPPGGILPDEIQRLEYPLHAGQEWVIRETPLFSSTAERMEVLDLPAGRMNGWRIRIHSGLFGENDTVYLWYGRSGFLAMEVHLETETVKLDGSVVTMVSEETLYLESYDLDGDGRDKDDPGKGGKAESEEKDLALR